VPIKKTVPGVTGNTNIQILNKIRKYASTDYRNRIPEATEANIQQTVQSLMDNTPHRNEFASALVNKVGLSIARNQLWTNKLAEFKLGLMQFGETIEEIQVGLVTAKVYNSQTSYMEKDIFGRKDIDVQASYHNVNRQAYYDITIDEPILSQAFQSDMGLSTFVSKLMDAPATSDNWDEFLLMSSLLRANYDANGFFKVNVPNVKGKDSTNSDSKAALRAVIEMVETLPFISTYYNASGMPVAAESDELVLFVTPAFKAAIGVEALAAAFNIEFTDIPTRMVTIPEAQINIPGAQAILTTKDFFVVADTRYEMTSAPNPVGLYQNFFLHHWQIISLSKFVPAILFTSSEPSTVIPSIDTPVTSVTPLTTYDATLADVTVFERGSSYGVVGSALTTPTGGLNDSVRLELIGALSPLSYISNAGNLHIAIDDAATSVTIRAISTENNAILAELVRPIVGDRAVLWPNPRVISDSDKDGIAEVTPAAPVQTGAKVAIPKTEGAIYKNGATVVTGTTITLAGSTTIVATAAVGWELATGATASWTFA